MRRPNHSGSRRRSSALISSEQDGPPSQAPPFLDGSGEKKSAPTNAGGYVNSHETRLPIESVEDIVAARQQGRSLANEMGFDGASATMITAAISEVTRNIVDHATRGEIVLSQVKRGDRRGLCMVARDHGPGIADIERAMQFGYSTRRGLGVGLPGAKRLMDEFAVKSKVGNGTTVTMTKWLD